jgi:hypothetical protein
MTLTLSYVAIPFLSIAFEYNGEQHYHFSGHYGSEIPQQNRDAEKRLICQKAEITLIEIPYWWDMKVESLLATVRSILLFLIYYKDTHTSTRSYNESRRHTNI